MLTTQALIDAALARGLRERLPVEWWRTVCPVCGESRSETADICRNGNFQNGFEPVRGPIVPVEICDPPDITAPKNLYELMRLADAVFDNPPNVSWRGTSKGIDTFAVLGRVDGNFIEDHGPDRTTAVLAACAKALGMEGVV